MGRSAAGRMINQDIALSAKVTSLSAEALSLFCLLIPHLNSHGKMAANPYVVKGNVCPLIEWLPVEKVGACLVEISAKTNVKWWRDDRGLYYLQSLNWKDHQSLREDRLGPDHLPDYPGDEKATPGILPEYAGTNPAKGKVREVKKEGKNVNADALRLSGLLADLIFANNPNNRLLSPERKDGSVERWSQDIDKMLRIDNRFAEEVQTTIEWCQANPFWRCNILSGSKLREKYDTLLLQMKHEEEKGRGAVITLATSGRRVF